MFNNTANLLHEKTTKQQIFCKTDQEKRKITNKIRNRIQDECEEL